MRRLLQKSFVSGPRSKRHGLLALCAVVAALWPLLAPSPYYVHISVLALLYIVLALGLSVVVNFAGLLDLGYVAFYAVGAYSYAILSTSFSISFGVGILIGGFLAAGFGVVLGFPTIRARGDYLALVTLAFGEAIRLILRNWDSVTNGPRGITGVEPPRIFSFAASQPVHFFYIVFVCVLFTAWATYRLKNSPVGRNLMAIRDDEVAAESVGISAVKWKLYSFAIGAFFAGIMGTFFAGWQRFVAPESFILLESIIILAMVILGGGTLVGTVVAAAFLTLMPEFLRGFLEYRLLLFGLVLIAVVIVQEKRWTQKMKSIWPSLSQRMPHAHGVEPDFPASPAQNHTEASQLLRARTSEETKEKPLRELLQGEDLSKHFDGIQALDEVNFSVSDGEIVGLIGPNGAGKTTLFNAISGLVELDEGNLYFQDKLFFHRQEMKGVVRQVVADVTHTALKPYRVAELGIGRTFQHVRLFGSMTAIQNILAGYYCGKRIMLGPVLLQTRRAQETERAGISYAEELLAFLGISSVRDVVVDNLTLASQRKVEIARALALQPKLLMLDEPAAGLNETEKKQFRQLLERVRSDLDVTILLIEHDMNVLMAVSDRVYCMDRGRIIAEGSPEDIQQNPQVRMAYLGTDTASDEPGHASA